MLWSFYNRLCLIKKNMKKFADMREINFKKRKQNISKFFNLVAINKNF